MKSFNAELKRARAEKGITHADSAAMFGMSWSEYLDFEADDDEWLNVAPAYMLRGPIALFRIDWEACRAWEAGQSIPSDMDLNDFILNRRKQIELTREQMADRAGFNVGVAEAIEAHQEGLALWPLAVAILLAEALGLDERSVARRLVTIGR